MIIGNIPFLHTPKEKSIDDQTLYKDLMEFRLKCMIFAQGRTPKKTFVSSVERVLQKYSRSRSAIARFKQLADIILYNFEENKDSREERVRKGIERNLELAKRAAYTKHEIDKAWRKK